MYFNRFMTSYTGEAACNFLIDAFKDWDMVNFVQSFTTDNASDMISGM